MGNGTSEKLKRKILEYDYDYDTLFESLKMGANI
jgi:hypothetical protein